MSRFEIRGFKNYFIFFITIFIFSHVLFSQDKTTVLYNWPGFTDAPNSLYHYLTDQACQLLDKREAEVSSLVTPEEWCQRQTRLKQTLWDILGPFPEKTPLNPKVTSKQRKDGYTLENVIYESLPGYYVTATLFIPVKLNKPGPAILFCSGHSTEAYRRHIYQLPLLNLVKKGFIVLAFDPVGQGERLQYYDEITGKSIIGGSTKEHSYPSVQVSLLGQSVARYFVWDGIRGIDYLLSRKEVDPERIGVHGLSGGGTQTAYISALDDRVAASAPACYITSFRRLIMSQGVQDGEQNFYHGIQHGIDHADLIEIRAPKPTLIMAMTRDFFSIQGTRETYSEAKRVYTILDSPDNIELVEDDYEHGYTKKNREAMYAFFQKHLNLPGSYSEEEVEYLTEEELQVTKTGQLSTSFECETMFSLNFRETGICFNNLQTSRENFDEYRAEVINSAKELSGYAEPSYTEELVFTGRYQEEGYVLEKYYITGEVNYPLPFILLIPEDANGKAIMYLDPAGKSDCNITGGEIKLFMDKGFTVLIPDLLGMGEMYSGGFKGDACIEDVSYNMWFTAMQIGRSIVGIQASDLVKLGRLLRQNFNCKSVYGVAKKEMSPLLLHVAAFSPVISRIALLEPYSSYRSLASSQFYKPSFVHSLVPGALTRYDLPDLAACLSPAKLLISGMTTANGGNLEKDDISKDMQVIRNRYKTMNAENNLIMTPMDEKLSDYILQWLE